MATKELFSCITAFRILITSMIMMVLSLIFGASAIFNGNIEHAALGLILNALSMYEINEKNRTN